MELWRDVLEYEGLYQVSNLGRIKSVDRKVFRKGKAGVDSWKHVCERIRKQYTDKDGYSIICLAKVGVIKAYKVHVLVMRAFIGPRPTNFDIRHLDSNPSNNNLENLKYGTRIENMEDARKLGRLKGEYRGFKKLIPIQVREIKKQISLGSSQYVIAKNFSISQATVSMIATGKTWVE